MHVHNMKQVKTILLTGAALGGTAVIAGAFGSHFLEERIMPEHLAVFETAARYQMYHALALCVTGAIAVKNFEKYFGQAALCFVVGTLIFCGSLYALSTSEIWAGKYMRPIGAITPIGGVFIIAGWMLLIRAVLKAFK